MSSALSIWEFSAPAYYDFSGPETRPVDDGYFSPLLLENPDGFDHPAPRASLAPRASIWRAPVASAPPAPIAMAFPLPATPAAVRTLCADVCDGNNIVDTESTENNSGGGVGSRGGDEDRASRAAAVANAVATAAAAAAAAVAVAATPSRAQRVTALFGAVSASRLVAAAHADSAASTTIDGWLSGSDMERTALRSSLSGDGIDRSSPSGDCESMEKCVGGVPLLALSPDVSEPTQSPLALADSSVFAPAGGVTCSSARATTPVPPATPTIASFPAHSFVEIEAPKSTRVTSTLTPSARSAALVPASARRSSPRLTVIATLAGSSDRGDATTAALAPHAFEQQLQAVAPSVPSDVPLVPFSESKVPACDFPMAAPQAPHSISEAPPTISFVLPSVQQLSANIISAPAPAPAPVSAFAPVSIAPAPASDFSAASWLERLEAAAVAPFVPAEPSARGFGRALLAQRRARAGLPPLSADTTAANLTTSSMDTTAHASANVTLPMTASVIPAAAPMPIAAAPVTVPAPPMFVASAAAAAAATALSAPAVTNSASAVPIASLDTTPTIAEPLIAPAVLPSFAAASSAAPRRVPVSAPSRSTAAAVAALPTNVAARPPPAMPSKRAVPAAALAPVVPAAAEIPQASIVSAATRSAGVMAPTAASAARIKAASAAAVRAGGSASVGVGGGAGAGSRLNSTAAASQQTVVTASRAPTSMQQSLNATYGATARLARPRQVPTAPSLPLPPPPPPGLVARFPAASAVLSPGSLAALDITALSAGGLNTSMLSGSAALNTTAIDAQGHINATAQLPPPPPANVKRVGTMGAANGQSVSGAPVGAPRPTVVKAFSFATSARAAGTRVGKEGI